MSEIAINQTFSPKTATMQPAQPHAKKPSHHRLWLLIDDTSHQITGVYTKELYANRAYQSLDYPMAYHIEIVQANRQFC